MENNMGKQIRNHRLRCNMTQERLAEALNVTAQAVSKWENGAGYPDISLLPELSAALGITVDELFESSFDTHLHRIQRMLENSPKLSPESYDYAEKRLREGCLDPEHRGGCLTMLADLHNHRARMHQEQAAGFARQALELEPEKHCNHAAYCEAAGGVFLNWSISNHTRIIEFYKGYIRRNPSDRAGYMWLMDNLIADGRLAEAREALENMGQIKMTYHYYLYKGWIAWAESGWAAADVHWQEMVERYGDDWRVWSSRADTYARRADYPRAIEAYHRAAELEQRPCFTDNYQSIAQICQLIGDRAGAIEAYEKVVEILRRDWDLQEGETILGYLETIRQLREG